MQLLGVYRTNLSAFYYEELLTLLNSAIIAGDYSGNATFTEAELTALIQQAQDFASLPVPAAGQRTTDEAFNTPLSLLTARLSALVNESNDFSSRAQALLDVLNKDTLLLDQLLAAAEVERWVAQQPTLTESDTFYWDFGMGYGNVTSAITLTDPATGVLYPSRPPLRTYYDTELSQLHAGLAPALTERVFLPKAFTWTYSTTGQVENNEGVDWTGLNILEPRPKVEYAGNPQVQVILPEKALVTGIFDVQGDVAAGSVPIYVRTTFYPRRNQSVLVPTNACSTIGTPFPATPGTKVYIEALVSVSGTPDGTYQLALSCRDVNGAEIQKAGLLPITAPTSSQIVSGVVTLPTNSNLATAQLVVVLTNHTTGTWSQSNIRVHLPQQLSVYQVDPDSVNVYIPKAGSALVQLIYTANVDYVVDSQSNLTFMNVPDGTGLTVRFTELFPAYQCSVNEVNWSPVVILDPARPQPDDVQGQTPVKVVDGAFPITDELGVPTGMTIRMIGKPLADYYIQVSTPAAPNYGLTAVLEIDMEQSAYMNGIRLSPFSSFPAKLTSIQVQGLSIDTKQTVWQSPTGLELDRPMTLDFDRQLVGKAFLTFYQENYTLQEYIVDPNDKLRRDTLYALQAVLPFSVRSLDRAQPTYYRGAQYDFGLENVAGIDAAASTPTVFVSGPYRYDYRPELLRLDAQTRGTVNFYLCFNAYDATGTLIDLQATGIALTPGTAIVFPFATNLNRAAVARVDVYLKAVLRSADALVDRFLIQLVHV